jgi:hypothetical protein
MILNQDTIKDLMLLYDQAETSIQDKVMAAIMPESEANKLDNYIDILLHQLMTTDKQWQNGGTMRVHMDAY